MPLPDHDFDVTETAVPWKVLTRAGHEVVFATETGKVPECDRRLLTGVIFGQLGAARQAKAFYAEMKASREFLHPYSWSDLNPADFAALFLAGGHAPGMRQYLDSEILRRKVAAFWTLHRPVAAICHGVLVLARTKTPAGVSVLHDYETTCLPKYMERTAYWLTAWKLGRYYRTYRDYVEDEVEVAAGHFERGPTVLFTRGTDQDDRAAFVVRDRNYVSARWPGDAYKIAKELIDLLEHPEINEPLDWP